MKQLLLLFPAVLAFIYSFGQLRSGKVIDATSREPLPGAIITSGNHTTQSGFDGAFAIPITNDPVVISHTGYILQILYELPAFVSLQRNDTALKEVVITANRTIQQRIEAPVAIGIISQQQIEESKAQRLDFLLNKVSGVFMVNLGNEQHQMSIRQPMTTKSLFLYLEDGIPIRTTGVYNHNALLEMNLPAARSIEVIKGPSSALYGAEAIGGAVNVITRGAPALFGAQVSVQANDKGYKRTDFEVGGPTGKWGFLISGYYADKRNGPIEYSDFHKGAITLRSDYRPNEKTSWTNTLSVVDYYSDMSGAIDSTRFAQKNYASMQTFTYRKTFSLRYKSLLSTAWNSRNTTQLALVYRRNSVKQNPAYAIASTSNPTQFKGQINDNSFSTYALFATHSFLLPNQKSKLIGGMSIDYSPQDYEAVFIAIQKDLATNKYTRYTQSVPDSLLSRYQTGIINLASYINYEWSPSRNWKLVASLRYDAFRYYFINNLPGSASVSTASTINRFERLTPKLGLVYNFKQVGFYGNFSQGYVPPQLTDLYSSVKVAPYLLPQTFTNYEAGGWASLLKNKIYIDWSLYRLDGTNEIISVRQPDNSYINQNAGSTRHIGVEYGIVFKPLSSVSIRFSGTNAKHRFISNIVKGVDYSGKTMSGAPSFVSNAEISYKPAWVPGLRVSAEWQHQGNYFMDDLDKTTYSGFDVINLRFGYRIKRWEMWINLLNATNRYYSVISTKNAMTNGSSAYAYSLGDPRECTLGFAFHFGK